MFGFRRSTNGCHRSSPISRGFIAILLFVVEIRQILNCPYVTIHLNNVLQPYMVQILVLIASKFKAPADDKDILKVCHNTRGDENIIRVDACISKTPKKSQNKVSDGGSD